MAFKKGDIVRVDYNAYIADIERLYDTTSESALCVTDGTEAYTVKPGETGVSFTADSISDEDAGRLFSDTYRTKMAGEVMGLIVSSGIYFYYQDIEITDVSDYKRSLGSKAENDSRTCP